MIVVNLPFPPSTIARFRSKIRIDGSGCHLWMAGKYSTGYGQFCAARKNYYAHRLAWEFVNGPIPDGMVICHKCDIRACVNPEHLFVGTYTDNNRDREAKGRGRPVHGERHYNRKLTTADVLAIRASNLSCRQAAQQFGVSPASISLIRNGINWRRTK